MGATIMITLITLTETFDIIDIVAPYSIAAARVLLRVIILTNSIVSVPVAGEAPV
jgi:hypothetical protein